MTKTTLIMSDYCRCTGTCGQKYNSNCVGVVSIVRWEMRIVTNIVSYNQEYRAMICTLYMDSHWHKSLLMFNFFLEMRVCWWSTVTGCVTPPGPRSPRMSSAHARVRPSRVRAWPVSAMTRAPASVPRRHVTTPRVRRLRAFQLTPARVSARQWRLPVLGLCSGHRTSAPALSSSLQRSSSAWSSPSWSSSPWCYSTATSSFTSGCLSCRLIPGLECSR